MSAWSIVLVAWLGGAFPIAVVIGKAIALGERAQPAVLDSGDTPSPRPMPPATALAG